MFITVHIQASINKGIEEQIEDILSEAENETFDTECLINTEDISHCIRSNDGTTTIIFKSQEDSIVTTTPYGVIKNAIERSGNKAG